jgi:2-polyprenyl-3-methyl-5-hydroxy-6-metoxy-1,4-benzoquinol methylase
MNITTTAERLKYHAMWTKVPGYRSTSPGERLVPHFLDLAQPSPGDTLIDLGCGSGRASVALAEAGLNVTQLDITETSRDPHARGLPFIEACLWDLPELPKFNWVYCCDVMEHLPTHTVDKALDHMAAITGKGAFMQIALFPEAFGRFIGETLHLTVKPAEWWQEKINKRWHTSEFVVKEERLIFLTGEPR